MSKAIISIHALRKESNEIRKVKMLVLREFQSTLSVRRATSFLLLHVQHCLFQSTLSVRRATRRAGRVHGKLWISIHALRKESDGSCARPAVRRLVFQSTLSVRRATCRPSVSWRFRRISIHALRKESDAQRLVLQHLLAISIHALRKESDLDYLIA